MTPIKITSGVFTIAICSLLSIQSVNGQTNKKSNDLFNNFKKRRTESFNNYKEKVNKEFQAYEKAEKEAFNNFKRKVNKIWGSENFKESTKKNWVEYSNDYKTRTDVDFESGQANIEIIINENELSDSDLVKEKVEKAVEKLATDKGTTKDYSTEMEQPTSLGQKPILEGQLADSHGYLITSSNVKQYAREIVNSTEIKKTTIKGDDNTRRVKVSVTLPLAPENIKVRARKVLKYIQDYAVKYNLPNELVLAIIHTESFYNPKARSHVPAFGLMQLVPRYGGRDAYKYIYKKDRLLGSNYLYIPVNNIELGTAYFHILMTRSFRNVKNEKSRLYCSIAAYNTGAGNVSKAFIGTTKLYQAIPKINAMTPDQVYTHMRKNLPSNETKDYIKKVSERMESYRSWINN